MRTTTGDLALVLASGSLPLLRMDLFTVTLRNGTIFRWTSYERSVVYGGNTFTTQSPFINRTKWTVTNKLEVPTMEVYLYALNSGFNGGPNVKLQAHNGLFDGAQVKLESAFATSPVAKPMQYGDPNLPVSTVLGTVVLFKGDVGAVDIIGQRVTLTVKGRINRLDRGYPRNVYQVTCGHTFTDAGCTLLKASFTTAYTVGSSPAPTKLFIPWSSAPSTPSRYVLGTATFTSGPAAGEARTIIKSDASGITLIYPLYNTPVNGNGFTAMEGCDKTRTRCTALSNIQHFRGFPYVPPAEFGY